MRGGLLSCLPEYGPPPMSKIVSKSRRATPWDHSVTRTASQSFIRSETKKHYSQRHQKLRETDEAALINSFTILRCPFCGSEHIKKNGKDPNGIQKYYCLDNGAHFLPTTKTIFEDRKIPITEWIEYWRNLIQYESLTADSWNNKNAFTTSKYWFKKTCLLLEHIQDEIILKGTIYYDEMFYSLRNNEITKKADGKKPRGHSKNQMCIGVATDGEFTVIKYLGTGEPTQKAILKAFINHIEQGSTLITDLHRGHKKLVSELKLGSVEYDSKKLKGLSDTDNPLNPVNQKHNHLRKFLNAHSGFLREELPDYINLFLLITNPPKEKLEKIDILLNLGFQSAVSLKYRTYFKKKPHN